MDWLDHDLYLKNVLAIILNNHRNNINFGPVLLTNKIYLRLYSTACLTNKRRPDAAWTAFWYEKTTTNCMREFTILQAILLLEKQ